MQIVIDIPKSLYANLQKIQNGSIAAKRILECVRNGKSVMFYPQVEGITPTVVEPNEVKDDTESVRQELLERGDEMVSFRQLVERFEEVEKEYKGIPWNLKQIYNNFNILIGEKRLSDCINREAAIDLADELKDDLPDDDHLSDMVMSHNEGILEYQTKLSLLPPVTPQQDTVPFDFELYQAGLMDMPEGMIEVLDKIRAEIDAHREKLKIMADDDWYAGKIRGYDCAIEIINKYKASPTGAEGSEKK